LQPRPIEERFLPTRSAVGGPTCVLCATLELDLATHNQLESASTVGQHETIVIELGEVTFMDCSG
jgi:anti-anti-sigma regulatory factor